jgi:CubicO group peptidase (beta-lactamase class C family)
MFRVALLALTVLLAPPPASGQDARTATLDSALTALHSDGFFDGALAVSDVQGEIVYTFAAGDYQGRAITPQTPMPLASVTKAMTAAAALSLAAEGVLDLDAPVGRYLDPWPYPAVTVRHLLDQTSGLHFLTALTAHRDPDRPVTTEDLLRIVAEHRPGLAHEPGSAFDYDNANYEALAAVLEAATGQTYADVMRERVTEPAGMRYAATGSPGEIPWAAWAGGGGDAVIASVQDLAAFDDAFWSGRIVPDSLVRAARRPPTLADGSESRYVFGRFVETDPRPLIGHFGDGGETKSALYRERDEGGLPGTTYALISSDDGVYRTPILVAVMAIWNGEPFSLPLPRTTADVPDSVLAQHVGIYESGIGRLHITLEDGQLHLEPEGAGGSEPLIAGSETVFYFCCQDLTWEFVLGETGETIALQIQGNEQTRGEKVR